MTKRPADLPLRAKDCKTVAQKVAWSNMVREKFESLGWNDPPSAHGKLLDEFPFDERYPWTHPEWSAMYGKSEREKNRAQRKLMRGK